MNQTGIPLKEFSIESLGLEHFERIVDHPNTDLSCNVLQNRFEPNGKLELLKVEIIKERVYFFLRWYEYD